MGIIFMSCLGTPAMNKVSRMSKPNLDFLAPLIKGTGSVTNVSTVNDRINADFLAPLNKGWLRKVYFGKNGEKIIKVHYSKYGEEMKSACALPPDLDKYGLKSDNFEFKKAVLGVNDPTKEVIIVAGRGRRRKQREQKQNRNSSSRTAAAAAAAAKATLAAKKATLAAEKAAAAAKETAAAVRKAASEAHFVAAATPTNDSIYFNSKKSIYRDNQWI